MTTLAMIVLTGAAAVLVVLVTQASLVPARRDDLVTLELRFPRDLHAEQVEAFLSGATGLATSRWQRRFVTPTLAFEIEADATGVQHRLVVPRRWLPTVEGLLRAHLPTTRVIEIPTTRISVQIGAELLLTSTRRQLTVHAETLSRSLHATLQPLHREERIVVAWLLSPHVGLLGEPRASGLGAWLDGTLPKPTADQAATLRRKQAKPLFLAVGRIGTSATSPGRRHALLNRTRAAWQSSQAPGVRLARRRLPERFVARRLAARAVPLRGWPAVLNTEELAALGWPIGVSHLPGVRLSGSRMLSVPRTVDRSGTVIGDGVTDGETRPAAMDLQARFRHLTLLGPTGTGKSTLLLNLIVQDMEAGHAVLVLDPKADLVADVLARVPANRTNDVVLLDASDAARPIGVHPFRLDGLAPELAVEHLVGILRRIFTASWGVRSDDLWRAALRTLIHDPDATFADVGPLLTEASFRRPRVAQLGDPVLVSFWRTFEGMSDAEAAQVVGPVLNKWRQLMSRPSLRRVFGQAHPRFDLAASLNRGGVVLVPLAIGTLGEEAAGLLGAVLLGAVWNVIQGRTLLPAHRRRPLMIHLDEFARYANLPVPLEEILSQARSYRVGLTLATQHLDQLPPDLRQTFMANPRSRLAFQVGGSDARVLARDLGSGLTSEDLQGLGSYEIVTQLYAAGHTQTAASLITRPAPPITSDPSALRLASREQWGVDGEAVDTAIFERMSGPAPQSGAGDGATGRKRRAS